MNMERVIELRKIAGEIENWRVARGMSKNALCNRFGQLGSTKVYGRILNESDALDEMDVPKQLENYQAAWELLQRFAEDPEEAKVYGDFEWMRDGISTVGEALSEPGICRLVLITAGSGGGKSAFLNYLETDRRTANITYKVEATGAVIMAVNLSFDTGGIFFEGTMDSLGF